jgi:hypothetical protein
LHRLVILVALLGFLAAGCSDSTEPEASAEISSDAVAGRVTAALASVITMRADSSVTSSFAEQSTVVAQSQADIDLREGTVTSVATFTLDPNAEDSAEQTEEAVVVRERAYRRPPGDEWEPSGQTLVQVALPAFEQEGDDLPLALRTIVLAAPAPWIQTTGDDGTTYVSADEATGETLEVVIDDQGHLTRMARSQPPFGVEVDEPLRVGADTVFSEFDRTVVELPSDLPPE